MTELQPANAAPRLVLGRVHLVELVDAAAPLISHHERAGLEDEVAGELVLHHRHGQPGARRCVPAHVHAARRERGRRREHLRLADTCHTSKGGEAERRAVNLARPRADLGPISGRSRADLGVTRVADDEDMYVGALVRGATAGGPAKEREGEPGLHVLVTDD